MVISAPSIKVKILCFLLGELGSDGLSALLVTSSVTAAGGKGL